MQSGKKVFQSLSIVLFLIIISAGVTYSYFTALNNSGSTSMVTLRSGNMILSFGDNNPSLLFSDVIPGPTDSTADAVLDKEFTVTGVTNNSDVNMKYKLLFNISVNEFSNDSLGYILVGNNSSNGSLVGNAYTSFSSNNITKLNKLSEATSIDLGTGYFIPNTSNVNHTYHLYMYYIETGQLQDDAGAEFVGNIEIQAVDNL